MNTPEDGFNRFLRYSYAYYLMATTYDNRLRPHAVVCEFLERLVRATNPPTPEYTPYYPNRTRYFHKAKICLLDREEASRRCRLSNLLTDSFWTMFLPTKHFFEMTSAFPRTTAFLSWRKRNDSARSLSTEIRTKTSWGRSLSVEDFEYQGIVLTAIEPKRLLLHVSEASSLREQLRRTVPNQSGQRAFDMTARYSYIQSVLASTEAPREPDYWLGADVTALIDADSYAPIRHRVAHGAARVRAPYSDRIFVRAVDALCNNAGIYTLSLFAFPPMQFHPPIMKRWSELASHWATAEALPSGDQDGSYENRTEALIDLARVHFAAEYPFRRFGQLMSWLSIQINNPNSVRIFTNVDSSQTDIDRVWYFIKNMPHAQELSHFARGFGFTTYGNQSAGRLSPGDYAASYAFWSFAKAAPYKQRAPQRIDFLVSSQRLPLEEEPPVAQSPQAALLFPWGSILKTALDELGECDADWFYTLLLDLRSYTLGRLDPLCDMLTVERMQHIHTVQEKSEWPDHVMQAMNEFVAVGLLEALQQAFLLQNDSPALRPAQSALEILFKAVEKNRGRLLSFLRARDLHRVKRIKRL